MMETKNGGEKRNEPKQAFCRANSQTARSSAQELDQLHAPVQVSVGGESALLEVVLIAQKKAMHKVHHRVATSERPCHRSCMS